MATKRPLAVFGLAYLMMMLAACLLPARVALPVAVLLAAALLFVAVYCKIKKEKPGKGLLLVVLVALGAAVATGRFYLHTTYTVAPIQALATRQGTVQAVVLGTTPAYGGEAVDATLQIKVLDGEKPHSAFLVEVQGINELTIGDIVEVPLAFYKLGAATSRYQAAQNIYIGARAKGEAVVVGRSNSFFCMLRNWQYAAGDRIRNRLPLRLSSVASAMSIGDERFLLDEAKYAYRAAGLSHILVVSGMHVSILAGAVYALVQRVSKKKAPAAIAAIVTIAFFMMFTGLTPSIMRSGVANMLVYIAAIADRKADVFTSLGVAAIGMCTVNPFAAVDIGVLLSFTATIGAIAGAGLQKRWLQRKNIQQFGFLKKAGAKLAGVAISPICVTVATLPVLLLFDMGISILSVPVNIIVVPLLTPLLFGSILMLLPEFPVINILAQAGTLLTGALLVVLEKLTNLCAAISPKMLHISGVLTALVLILYLFAYLAYKSKRFAAYALAALILSGIATSLDIGMSKNIVRISVVGAADTPSVVVTQNGKAVVILRDRRALWKIEDALARQNIASCALLLDMRANPQDTNYRVAPDEIVRTSLDIRTSKQYNILQNVSITVQKQGEGTLVCIDVAGYKIGVTTGKFYLDYYPPLDIMVTGRGGVTGNFGKLLTNGSQLPEWSVFAQDILERGVGPELLLRPGRSIKIRGGQYGLGMG